MAFSYISAFSFYTLIFARHRLNFEDDKYLLLSRHRMHQGGLVTAIFAFDPASSCYGEDDSTLSPGHLHICHASLIFTLPGRETHYERTTLYRE